MPTINHVLETALYVKDRARSQAFYENVLGFRVLLDDGERISALAVGGSSQILLLFTVGGSTQGEQTPGGFIPPHDGRGTQHVAFAIATDTVDEWRQQLSTQGVPIESIVLPPRGGTSIYFRDPDNHIVELASPGIWETY